MQRANRLNIVAINLTILQSGSKNLRCSSSDLFGVIRDHLTGVLAGLPKPNLNHDCFSPQITRASKLMTFTEDILLTVSANEVCCLVHNRTDVWGRMDETDRPCLRVH